MQVVSQSGIVHTSGAGKCPKALNATQRVPVREIQMLVFSLPPCPNCIFMGSERDLIAKVRRYGP